MPVKEDGHGSPVDHVPAPVSLEYSFMRLSACLHLQNCCIDADPGPLRLLPPNSYQTHTVRAILHLSDNIYIYIYTHIYIYIYMHVLTP